MAKTQSDSFLIQRTLIVLLLTALFAGAFFLIWFQARILLVIFGGILFGVGLDGLARVLRRFFPKLGHTLAVGIALGIVLLVLGGLVAVVSPQLLSQADEMQRALPRAIETIRAWLGRYWWGEYLLDMVPTPGKDRAQRGSILGSATGMFSSALDFLVNVVVMFFIGIFTAFNPKLYERGIIYLAPPRHRPRFREVLSAIGRAQRLWLLGTVFEMITIGTMMGVGMWIAGVPMALTLGILTGLLQFIPYVGPVMAAIPAVLVGMSVSPETGLLAAGVYSIVQFVETYLITPFMQYKVVSMPPALLIASQLLMGVTCGAMGILLATPLFVTGIVIIQMLYVEDVVGTPVEPLGESQERKLDELVPKNHNAA
jgi:predicted PurR-regulated permease PerM